MLALAALVPLLWMWPAGREDKPAARARRSAAFAVAVVGFTELGLEILLLLGFQALYGYVYHELTILVALFMVGVALGAWWALRSAPEPGPCFVAAGFAAPRGPANPPGGVTVAALWVAHSTRASEQRGRATRRERDPVPRAGAGGGIAGWLPIPAGQPRLFWRRAGKRPLARRALCPGPCRGLRRGSGAERSADSRLRISAHGSAYGRGESSPGGDGGCVRPGTVGRSGKRAPVR